MGGRMYRGRGGSLQHSTAHVQNNDKRAVCKGGSGLLGHAKPWGPACQRTHPYFSLRPRPCR